MLHLHTFVCLLWCPIYSWLISKAATQIYCCNQNIQLYWSEDIPLRIQNNTRAYIRITLYISSVAYSYCIDVTNIDVCNWSIRRAYDFNSSSPKWRIYASENCHLCFGWWRLAFWYKAIIRLSGWLLVVPDNMSIFQQCGIELLYRRVTNIDVCNKSIRREYDVYSLSPGDAYMRQKTAIFASDDGVPPVWYNVIVWLSGWLLIVPLGTKINGFLSKLIWRWYFIIARGVIISIRSLINWRCEWNYILLRYIQSFSGVGGCSRQDVKKQGVVGGGGWAL